ncbi:MAG: hypothetical protein AB7I98_16875 [Verrucomicrobiales bacterium]|nr:hypothetical protein [Verrucomicrobiae bacterium]
MFSTINYITKFWLTALGVVAAVVTIIAYPEAFALVKNHTYPIIIAVTIVSSIGIIYSRERYYKNLILNLPKVDKSNGNFGGLLKVWSNRESITTEEATTNVENSRQVDLLGFTMKNRYLKPDSKFDEIIRKKLSHDKQFFLRVVLADPDRKEPLRRRVEIEDGPQGIPDRLIGAVEESLKYLNKLKQDFCAENLSGEGCQIRVYLVPADCIFGNLVITDQNILLTSYLFRTRGTGSPTFLIEPKDSPLGNIYCNQLNKLIEFSREYHPPELPSNTAAIN